MKLNILVFLGSVRTSTPPKPARLGERVARQCVQSLVLRGHSVTLVDPLELDFQTAEDSKMFKPHFAFGAGRAPRDLSELAEKIRAADAYVMVSPEYNHSMSPALADMLNHFGSSIFSYKPSAIVSYSAGQWGGTRAAITMRGFLSELGCLPVSAMIHIPNAAEVFDADGTISDQQDARSWDGYLSRTWDQLVWWAQATRNHREQVDSESMAKPFVSDPSQRNAGRRRP